MAASTAAATAGITGSGGPSGGIFGMIKKWKANKAAKKGGGADWGGVGGSGGGGSGAHTHGAGGKLAAAEPAEAPVEETVAEEPAPTTMKSSPNKLKGSLSTFKPKEEEPEEKKGGMDIGGMANMASSFMYKSPAKNMKTGDYAQSFEKGYKPYQMKAAGKYNNSPIEKNYGSPAQRGFNQMAAFGTKSNEMDGGVGSAFDYASPAKGWFKNLAKKLNPVRHVKNLIQGVKTGDMKSILTGGLLKGKKGDAAADAQAGAEGGAVSPHSHNPGDGSIEAPGGGGDGDAIGPRRSSDSRRQR
jgi:hypothetical protein